MYCVQAIGLVFISYNAVYEDDEVTFFGNYKKLSKFLAFTTFSCIGFSCQSLIYILWCKLFSVIANFISAMIASLLITIVFSFIKVFLFIDPNPPNNNDIIEFSLQNNNENNEINNNNNEV